MGLEIVQKHCRLRQYSNNGTTKVSNERKGENGKRKNGKQKKGESKQGETRNGGTGGKRKKKERKKENKKQQETSGNNRAERENEKETNFCSSHFCSNSTLLERVAESDCVVCCPFAPSGSRIMVRKGWSVEDDLSKAFMEADFDMSSYGRRRGGLQRSVVQHPMSVFSRRRYLSKIVANSGLSRSLRLPRQPQARVRVLRNQRQKLRRSWPSWSLLVRIGCRVSRGQNV